MHVSIGRRYSVKVTVLLIIGFFSHGESSECKSPCNNTDLVQILEASVVKEDPFPLFTEQLSNVWMRKFYQAIFHYHCSWKEYIQQGNRLVQIEMYRENAGGDDKKFNKEFVSRTSENGVLEIQGSYDGTDSQIYNGRIYVFYSDPNALGVFFCNCESYDWNANIQVPFKLVKKLTENGNNEVKASVAAAEKAWHDMVEKQSATITDDSYVFPDLKRDVLVKVKPEDVCGKIV